MVEQKVIQLFLTCSGTVINLGFVTCGGTVSNSVFLTSNGTFSDSVSKSVAKQLFIFFLSAAEQQVIQLFLICGRAVSYSAFSNLWRNIY